MGLKQSKCPSVVVQVACLSNTQPLQQRLDILQQAPLERAINLVPQKVLEAVGLGVMSKSRIRWMQHKLQTTCRLQGRRRRRGATILRVGVQYCDRSEHKYFVLHTSLWHSQLLFSIQTSSTSMICENMKY